MKKFFSWKNSSLLKKLFFAVILLGLIAVILFSSINFYMMGYARKNMKTIDEFSGDSAFDCILVLGAKVWDDGELSPMLKERVDQAVALYKAGVSDKMIMSGDHATAEYDEVNAMKDYAIREGVPSENIFLDHAGLSTYESMYRARDIFGVKRLVVVTQKYHLYRSVYNARKLGLDATGSPAELLTYSLNTKLYNNTRESLARLKDFYMCIAKPEPTFLGDSISLDGDARLTDGKIIPPSFSFSFHK